MSHPSLLHYALANFDRAAARLKGEVDAEIIQKIRTPKERIELRLDSQWNDGQAHTFKAVVVRHSDALGPAKGGIRMDPAVTLDDVTGLAMEMAWKCSLIGVPFGGGKSGIVADPRKMARLNKEALIRSFVRSARRHIGPLLYVPAPDMGTDEADMGYVKDTIAQANGHATTQGCYVTGKPVICGGILGRREATGRGVVDVALQAIRQMAREPRQVTAVVQGFGNVGSVTVQCLADHGIKVIGVGDLNGAIHQSGGLDVAALKQYAARTGTVAGFPQADAIDPQKLLELECDLLIPAAAASQLTEENAGRIGAKLIVEAANSPTTPGADRIFEQRGVKIVPDILANAGGVFVSYLEYAQETQQEQMTEQEVNSRLRQRMVERYVLVADTAGKLQCPMRDAAMYLALRRLCDAVLARGLLA